MEVYRGGNDALYKDPRAQNITFLTVSPSIRANFEGGSIPLPNVVGMPYLTRVHWTQYTSRTHQQLVDTSQLPALKKRLSMGSFGVHLYHDRLALHRCFSLAPLLGLALPQPFCLYQAHVGMGLQPGSSSGCTGSGMPACIWVLHESSTVLGGIREAPFVPIGWLDTIPALLRCNECVMHIGVTLPFQGVMLFARIQGPTD